ncbi:heparan-alpha-glucosaminide N-acetyltransferase [Roseateles asaccharophilus]|uniref:Membrane protein n=1 Tax=Roseateles asaccharophilus TaxID=582607 RepID=A0ABU2ABJ2_9BURK|nr:heparan-alpha-glucosaminide N-acetyltransferase [Roseateles asaccharophilus]MDR7333958.1 putative membrane protein [Roseateles asaccharophilus]
MPAAAADTAPRFDRLDALRGAAIVWMAAFHFCFDLNHFGWIRQDFYGDPVWTWQRTAIVSLFLFCAGGGQALAVRAVQGAARFWRRWAQVAGCALLVSLSSWFMFPNSWISFGVLHGIAVMQVLLRLGLARLPDAALLGLAALAIAAPWLVQHPFFDTRWTNWLGLVTHKPITEDYVPVLPWLGVMLLGFVVTRMRPQLWVGPAPAPLAGLGRWSLSFYMVHQPVLIGGLMAVQVLR